MKKYILSLLLFFTVGLLAENSIELKGDKIESQSFKIDFGKSFGTKTFLSYKNDNKVKFYISTDNKVEFELPDFYGNQSWVFDDIIAISFQDINNDGDKDIIVMANYMTGVGNEGVIPFQVIGVYYFEKNSFKTDEKLNDTLNTPQNLKKLTTIKSVVNFIKKQKK